MNRTSSKNNKRNNKSSSNHSGWNTTGPSTTRVQLLGGFNDRMRVRLRYNAPQINASVTTTPSTQVIRGNGPFDPDVTSTGGQPNGYDTYALIYNQYRVYSATVRAWVSVQSTTLNTTASLSARHSSTAIGVGAMDDFMSNPYCVRTQIGNAASRGQREPHLQLTVKTSKFLALPIVSDNLASVYTTTPAKQWFFHINVINADETTSTSFTVSWEVTYDVEWFDRAEQTLSLVEDRIKTIRSFNLGPLQSLGERKVIADPDELVHVLPSPGPPPSCERKGGMERAPPLERAVSAQPKTRYWS